MPSILQHPLRLPPPSPQGGAQSLSALVQQLANRNTACGAARAIADMASSAWVDNDPGTHAKIIAAGALPPLVALSGAGSTAAIQEQAAGTIFFLTSNAGSIIKITDAGAIPPLVALLGS